MSDRGSPILSSLAIQNPALKDLAAFIGEIARPFAVISVFASISWGFLGKVDPTALGVMMGGGVAIYGVKGTEKIFQTRADAEVKKTVATTDADVQKTVAATVIPQGG